MPKVLAMKNSHSEIVFSPRDFEELINKHMGWDRAKYYHNLEQLSSYIRELDGYVDDSTVHSDTEEEVLKCNGY